MATKPSRKRAGAEQQKRTARTVRTVRTVRKGKGEGGEKYAAKSTQKHRRRPGPEKGVGRGPGGECRTIAVLLKFSEREMKVLTDAVKKAGAKNRAEYIRATLLPANTATTRK